MDVLAQMVISRYLGMFSLDTDKERNDILLMVISRYLGMFSLDGEAKLMQAYFSRYFPLSWDVLIRSSYLSVSQNSSMLFPVILGCSH